MLTVCQCNCETEISGYLKFQFKFLSLESNTVHKVLSETWAARSIAFMAGPPWSNLITDMHPLELYAVTAQLSESTVLACDAKPQLSEGCTFRAQ